MSNIKHYHKTNITIVALYVLLLIVASWYLTPHEPYEVKCEKDVEVSESVLLSHGIKKSSDRYYFKITTEYYRKQKRLIPLFYKKELINKTESTIFSEPLN